jgi:hypothetical protein
MFFRFRNQYPLTFFIGSAHSSDVPRKMSFGDKFRQNRLLDNGRM